MTKSQEIKQKYGIPRVITSLNTYAHLSEHHDFTKGIKNLKFSSNVNEKLIQYKLDKKDTKQKLIEIKSLLNIYEGRANDIGKFNNSFSSTWCENLSKKQVKKITHTTSNIFRRVFNTKSLVAPIIISENCKTDE